MAFCNQCGTQIPDGATTCAACAGRLPAATAPALSNAGGLTDNVAGMLAYFTFIPAVIFLVMEPYNKSRFIRFHAWQSLLFNAAWFVLWLVLRIVVHIPLLGWLTIFFRPVVWLAGFIIWIILVLKANQGQMYKLPTIGDMAEKQANAV
jgi:uncharacterized membrane protein